MKIILLFKTSLFMLVLYGWGMGSLHAHEKVNTLNQEEKLLIEVLDEISREHQVYFTYDSDIIKGVMVDYEKRDGESVRSILSRVLAEVNMDFKIFEERFVILFRKDEAGLKSLEQMISHMEEIVKDRKELFANRRAPAVARLNSEKWSDVNRMRLVLNVTGRVMDAKGEPLIGVNILVKGTNKGTTTDFEGRFSLNDLDDQAVLVVSYIGYKSQEVFVSGQTSLTVVMLEDVQALDEVVVTGYTTEKKKDITGAIAVVDMKALKSGPSRSAERALQGLASGVNVINSGRPGAGSKIFIRGVTSFGNTDPLIIVDGIAQDLNKISASDIESIQVLKDAGAASIYGVRGANGVIVVTTKKGKTGAPVISYEGSYGMQYPLPGNPYNVMNSREWMQMFQTAYPGNDLFKNGMPDYTFRGPSGAGSAMEGDPRIDPELYVYEKKNTGQNYIIQKVNKEGEDWFHNTFKKAPTMSHNITASGGTEKSRYLFGLDYLDQQGTFIKSYEKRYSARVNTSFTLKENIRFGENANIIYRKVPSIDASLTTPFRMVPLVPLKDIMGNWAGTFGGPDLGAISQSVAVQTRNAERSLNNALFIMGNAYAEVDFLKDFTARTSIGYNISSGYDQSFNANQPENIEQSTRDNSLSVSSSFGSTMTWTNTLNYTKLLDKHAVSFMVGTEAIETTSRGVRGGSARFFSDDFNYLVLSNGTTSLSNGSSISSNSLFSIFGKLDYQYHNKYLIGVTVRRDGSSKFGPEKRYGVFPSVSLGWRVSQESFMENVTWLSDLKLRASYGVLGSQNNVNSDNSFFLYNSGLGTTYYDINGTSTSTVSGFGQSRIGNTATGWEENVITNVGLDASILNNKLDFSIEYYKKKVNGLLFSQPLPAVILGNAAAPTINIGDIQNAGIDISAIYRGEITNNLRFFTGINFTSYKNEVVNIPDPGYFYAGSANTIGSIARNEIGHPVSSYYGYKILGLFNSDEEVATAPTQNAAAPGTFKFQDTNGDGVISAEDRIHLGNPNPDFTVGLNLGIEYKGFDLSGVFYGSLGNDAFNALKVYTHFLQTFKEQKNRDLLNAWTPQNTDTTIPKLSTSTTFSTNGVPSSFFVEDGSYLKLRSLSLGYTVNSNVMEKVGISLLRIYANASNLFTITKYSGIDPELGGSASNFGIDYGGYPNNELGLVFGLNITF